MTCDRVQAEISRSLDEDYGLSSDAACHLKTCADCEDFRADSIEIASRYAVEVRTGIERLRGEKPVTIRPRRAWLLPAAAAVLLAACCGVALVKTKVPPPRAVASRPMPAPETSPPRILVPDLDELGLLVEREPIPVRLEQELYPLRVEVSEISLPRNLRF